MSSRSQFVHPLPGTHGRGFGWAAGVSEGFCFKLGGNCCTAAIKTHSAMTVAVFIGLITASFSIFLLLLKIKERMHCPQTGGHFYSLQNEGHAHARPDGDGHDQIFFKLLQLVLSLPVLFGLQVRTRVAVLLM
jgi:hypothetical protein